MKYRTVFALNYDVEAQDGREAEGRAIELLEEEFGKGFTDIILMQFGVNTMEV